MSFPPRCAENDSGAPTRAWVRRSISFAATSATPSASTVPIEASVDPGPEVA
jgi:hypothetical protein